MSSKEPVTYLHCKKCVAEIPEGLSPRDFARTQVGINKDGLFEVWCNRHNISVATLTEELRKKLATAKCPMCEAGKVHVH